MRTLIKNAKVITAEKVVKGCVAYSDGIIDYVGEDTVEAWKKEFGRIGSFEDRQRDFETESLESGLFGPVVLRSALKKNSEK